MATTLAPNPSVTSDDSITDVTLTVIFSPCQPLSGRRRPSMAPPSNKGEAAMPVKEGWLTTAEAAEVLGLSQGTVKMAITRGTLKARKVRRINMITPDDLAEYRREHVGKQGWDKRRDAGYQPDPKRKARRERAQARQQQPVQPAENKE